jgi:putative transposase
MEGHGLVRRRRLPHWDLPGATYFITTCLEGSIPAQGLLDLERLRAKLIRAPRSENTPPAQWQIAGWKRTFVRCDWWLDRHPAVRHLADAALAGVVRDACYYWTGRRYDLLAYAVMPSHLHWVFRPLPAVGQVANLPSFDDSPGVGQVANLPDVAVPPDSGHVDNLPHPSRSARERIMHTLKRYTAGECNRKLGLSGAFWQDESYDHCVRDDDELDRIIEYVEFNPVKAGLADHPETWRFSSAYDRLRTATPVGQPLLLPT